MPETKGAKTEPTFTERRAGVGAGQPVTAEKKLVVTEAKAEKPAVAEAKPVAADTKAVKPVAADAKPVAADTKNEAKAEQAAVEARQAENKDAAKADAKVSVTEVPLTWDDVAKEGTKLSQKEGKEGGQGAFGEFATGDVVETTDRGDLPEGVPPAGSRPWKMSEPHSMHLRGNPNAAGYVSPDIVEW